MERKIVKGASVLRGWFLSIQPGAALIPKQPVSAESRKSVREEEDGGPDTPVSTPLV